MHIPCYSISLCVCVSIVLFVKISHYTGHISDVTCKHVNVDFDSYIFLLMDWNNIYIVGGTKTNVHS